MLSYDSRLQLIKSASTSFPIFFMCTMDLPVPIKEQINKYLKHFLWRKFGQENKGHALIAWNKFLGLEVKEVYECWTVLITIKPPY